MHERLYNDQATFRCINDYADIGASDSSGILAFAGTSSSTERRTITQGPYDISLLPKAWKYFGENYHDAVDSWADDLRNDTLRPVNLGVAILMHELAHTVPVADPKRGT